MWRGPGRRLAAWAQRLVTAAVGPGERLLLAAFAAAECCPWLQRQALWRTQQHFLVGVIGLISDASGRLLLCHHPYRGRHAWAPPGGWLRRGELPEVALPREIAEETGLQIAPGALLRVLQDARGECFEIVLQATLVGGQFRPSAEVDASCWHELGAPLPSGMHPRHRRLIEELQAVAGPATGGSDREPVPLAQQGEPVAPRVEVVGAVD